MNKQPKPKVKTAAERQRDYVKRKKKLGIYHVNYQLTKSEKIAVDRFLIEIREK